MPRYRLSYFDTEGRAELARLLFVMAWEDFVDKRYTQEEWQDYKPNSPYGVLPVLEVDGKPYFQSSAIVRYLARTFKLYGHGDIEELEVEQVLGLVQDVAQTLLAVYMAEPEVKETLTQQAKDEKIPAFMAMYETILKTNGTGYFVGSSITVADIAVFSMMDMVQMVVGDPYEDYPLTKQLVETVGSHQRIRAWTERPKKKQ